MNNYNHPACGNVSHNVTVPGNIVDMTSGSVYTIKRLLSDTLYNITVTSTYNSISKISTKSVRTLMPMRKLQLS